MFPISFAMVKLYGKKDLDEHKELILSAEVRRGGEEVCDFIAYHLQSHAEADDAALYPVVQKVLGSTDSTKTMSHNHVEVGRYIEGLASLKKNISG